MIPDKYDVFHIIGNKNRVLMIRKLFNQDGKATHSDLSYKLLMNPKSTKDHLKVLMAYEIVEKIESG